MPKVRDRSGSGIRFNSRLLPPYLKRAKSPDELIPWLYLQGVSTGGFQGAMSAPVGEQAKGLSANTVTRLKARWQVAYKAFDSALKRFGEKYPKAMGCLRKDRDELLAFYYFPAVHWIHLRTTKPIESTFATARLRTKKSRGCGSRETTLAMVFELMQSAQKPWKRIKGFTLLEPVVDNARFRDGEQVEDQSDRNAA